MRPPSSLHTSFFSSLKQVEKRLKLEDPSQPHALSPLPLPLPQSTNSFTDSLSSPLYLQFDQSDSHTSTLRDSSEHPQAFPSSSPQFPETQDNKPQCRGVEHPQTVIGTGNDSSDDIQRLMELLGLSDCGDKEEEGERRRVGLGDCISDNSCDCQGGFYARIVGVQGPKCKKEVERLEGWIEYFMNGCGAEEKREPLRLAYLLLGKASFVSEGADGGCAGLEFPSTIKDFLMNDPPQD